MGAGSFRMEVTDMGMTMTQKILARAAGLESVAAGDLIMANLDMVLANDITGPVSIQELEKFKKKAYLIRTGSPLSRTIFRRIKILLLRIIANI